jgi:chemotaxis protein CheC
METGNILGCAYVNALTRLIGTDLRPSAPHFIQDFGVSVLQQALMTQAVVSDSLLLCEIGFHRKGERLDWRVVFVPTPELQASLQRSLHAAP